MPRKSNQLLNQHTLDNVTSGAFNYLDEAVQSSLFRNGKVLTNRDPDGNDFNTVGMTLIKIELNVRNARTLSEEARPTCESNGFELLDTPSAKDTIDFFDHASVIHNYYPQCAQLVAESTGGRVYPFDHNIRSMSGKGSEKRIAGGQHVQEPIHLVHGDYTLVSAPQRLLDLTQPPRRNDTLTSILRDGETIINRADVQRVLDGGRFAIINVWRNIAPTPVSIHPLALCDSRSVDPEDLVVFEIHYQDRIGENYFAKHSTSHRWYYYPQMTQSEALLIKQWDSAGTLARSNGELSDSAGEDMPCTFSFHSAFDTSDTQPDPSDRCSIEVRCMVLYD